MFRPQVLLFILLACTFVIGLAPGLEAPFESVVAFGPHVTPGGVALGVLERAVAAGPFVTPGGIACDIVAGSLAFGPYVTPGG